MKKIKLFDYQEDMKSRIEGALCLHRSVMAQMPTGTGKTVLLASIVEAFLREHPESSVWIVAHRRELVSQIRETIQRVFSNHPVPLSKEGKLPTTPSLLHKEGSTSTPSPSSSEGGDVTAPPRRSEPLRSKVGGPSKVSPDCAGWDRLAEELADNLAEELASNAAFNATSEDMPVKAVSIQWLAKHYDEIEEEPGMIVIDEAHHALAKTYKEMWERFPKTKFLGLTATPCRLNGKGFTDLFDVLIQSWSVPEFISQGRLATYDFVSIKSDGVTQRLIDSLQKRGADGDYQNKEMDMLLNKRPSIERLYQAFFDFGKDRKGIVYAINISHAQAIAEFYREHGVVAVAIDSKTPGSLRKELIERFKLPSSSFSNHPVPLSKEGSTSHPSPLSSEERDVAGDAIALPEFSYRQRSFRPQGAADECLTQQSCDCLCGVNRLADNLSPIQVLVNVDIFSEGFDCPDVEFVQLARPTLSLAKYLQMVGRGLRVAPEKKNCVIIDNVGLYRVFGLPSQIWNWAAMFEGRMSKKKVKETVNMSITHAAAVLTEKDGKAERYVDTEMVMVVNHQQLAETFYIQDEKYLRTQFEKILPDSVGSIENMGFYSRYVYSNDFHMCRVLDNDHSHLGGRCAIFLHNDPTEYYWLSGELHDGSLVVMSDSHRYYWVEKGKPKEYIGCAKSYEEERKMSKRLEEIVKITNLRVNEKKLAKEENMRKLEPCRVGSKWGLQGADKRIIIPPIYRNIRQENGFFAFEQLFNHWGVMDSRGKVVIEPKYDKVKVTAEGMAILSDVTGKTQTINLR